MRGPFSTLEALCDALALARVAPVVACGWAARRRCESGGGWERRAGGATDRIFDLASLTKPMTAFAVARSQLALSTPLRDVLPEARASASEAIPIELLLAHRAGLEAHLPLFAPLVSGEPVDRSEALRTAASARRSDAAGDVPPDGFDPVYSDLGYLLVGEALARVEHASDAGAVIERLVGDAMDRESELGTARLLRAWDIDFEERVVPTEVVAWRGGEVRGLVHDENAFALTNDGGSGHAGMFGTIDAVLAFGSAAHDAIVTGDGPLAAGDLSWMVRERPGGTLRAGFDGKSAEGSSAGTMLGPNTFGHLGFTGTSLWIDPDAHVVVALLTNRVHPSRESTGIRAARPIAHDALFEFATAKA
jgi:serine-type D-Ala-D-Ala carboxypeptidase